MRGFFLSLFLSFFTHTHTDGRSYRRNINITLYVEIWYIVLKSIEIRGLYHLRILVTSKIFHILQLIAFTSTYHLRICLRLFYHIKRLCLQQITSNYNIFELINLFRI